MADAENEVWQGVQRLEQHVLDILREAGSAPDQIERRIDVTGLDRPAGRVDLAVLRRDGTLVTRTAAADDDPGASLIESVLLHVDLAASPAGLHRNRISSATTSDGMEQIVAYRTLGDLPLIAVAARPLADDLAGWWRRTLATGNLLTAALGVLGVLSALGIRSIRREARARFELEAVRTELERQAEERACQLREASQVKSDFLANMGHRTRTPMNAIIGTAEVLGEMPLDPARHPCVKNLHRAADSLLDMANQRLDLSRMDQGRIGADSRSGDAMAFLVADSRPAPVRHPEAASRSRSLSRPQSALPAPGTAPSTPPLRILLVEDSEYNRFVVETYLKALPCEVTWAENGARAVAAFQEGRYDLVLMDVQMPVMDGHGAARAIRDWEAAQGRPVTPIIALTAHAFAADVEQALAAGCNAHLAKPVRKADLVAAVRAHTAAPPAAGQAASGRGPVFVTVDPELRAVLPRFLDLVRSNADTIRQALDAGDFAAIHLYAHRMKGEGGAFGLAIVSELGAAIDQGALRHDRHVVERELAHLCDVLGRISLGDP